MNMYSEKVDKHIYLPPDRDGRMIEGCRNKDDWIELALAALDQAGFSVRQQNEVRKFIEGLA